MTRPAAREHSGSPVCRFCDPPLELMVVDLGMSPLAESFLRPNQIRKMEAFYPLHVFVSERCFLVQLEAFVSPAEIFSEYAYLSGFSTTWVEHARRYVGMIRERLGLGPDDFVVELASNDGYLLQHFLGTGIPILGVDPAANVARAAEARGVPTVVEFFGLETAHQLVGEWARASLVIGNNVLSQVPDLHDFLSGARVLLRDEGTATFELPHLLRLIERLEYDTIYHEHFSYFSFATLTEVLVAQGLEIYDVEELPTHGGSLRVFAQHAGGPRRTTQAVPGLLAREEAEGLRTPERYPRFAEDVKESKRALLDLLVRLRREGRQIVGYGAPGKGNTLLNYCGIRTDFLDYTVDRNPLKHGLYTPGTHIPIHPPERIAETRPEYGLVLPWNLVDEIVDELAYIAEWGGKMIVPIPLATVVDPGRRLAEAIAGGDAA